MPNHRPARTTLVLVGLLCSSLPLLATESTPKLDRITKKFRDNAKKAEVPSDMPAELSLTETREPARVGPSLTEEPDAPKDLVPAENPPPEGKPVRLLDNTDSALDTPSPDAADGKTEEEKLADERLQEMQNDQEKAQAEAKADEESKARAEAAAEEEAKTLADAKAADDSAKADASANASRKPSDEESDSSLSAGTRLSKYESPRYFGLDLQFSAVRYPNLGLTSPQLGSGGRILFEWMFYQGAGKFALGVGARFSSMPRALDGTGESIKVNTIGGEASLIYRADFWDHQLLVPFGKVGMDFDYVVMSRPDGSTSNQGSYQGIQYGGGLQLNLYLFERKNATLLDRKFGINETFFIFEYVKTTGAKAGGLNLAHDELRFGLRFEI